MDEIKAQKKALKKAYKKAKRKTVLGWKILTILCAILMVIFIPLCTILNTFDNTVAAFVGGTFWKLENEDPNAQYFTTDFSSPEEMVDYGLTVAQQVEAEGAALLMNNGALPLAKDAKVSTFSSSSVNLVYGGTGSGNIDASTADTLRTALEKVGVTVNPALWDFYTTGAGKDYTRANGGTVSTASATTAEVPWDVYTDDVKSSVAQYGDAAIVTLSRVGGEGADLSYGEVNYLALDDNEKAMLENLAAMKKSGEIKSIMVDKIENIEPPLAHMIPEGAGHIVLPIVSIAALFAIDWRLALASLVTFPAALVCMMLTFVISGKNFQRFDESSAAMNSTIVGLSALQRTASAGAQVRFGGAGAVGLPVWLERTDGTAGSAGVRVLLLQYLCKP